MTVGSILGFRAYTKSLPNILFVAILQSFLIANTSSNENPPDSLHSEQYKYTGEEGQYADQPDFQIRQQESEPEVEKPQVLVSYPHSPFYLTHLAQTERLIYDALTTYEKQLITRLELVQRYRVDYEDSVVHSLQQNEKHESDDWTKASFIASHPFLTYRMIRRLSKDLQEFQDDIWQSLENDLWETLESWRGIFTWPSSEQLAASARGLIRLQDFHDFDIRYFSDGIVKGRTLGGLTAKQCLEISQMALVEGHITAAMEWFQAAHYKVVHSEEKSATMDELTEAWERTYKAFQEFWSLDHFKTHDVFSEAKELLRQEFNRIKTNRTFENRDYNFRALCRGDKIKTEVEHSKLSCYYDKRRHPFWYLNPLRVEIHNWKPLIYEVHDFIGPQALAEISSSAIQATVTLTESGITGAQPTQDNTFTHILIPDQFSIELYALSRKIEMLTELHVLRFGASEAYFVSSFATGNHYEPRLEYFEPENEAILSEFGGKIATAHAIVHAPELGGELAFTLLGTLIKPVAGSLIVYNNLQRNGKVDQKLLQGSCPVLIGQKWVVTKWIHEYENFDKRPCLMKR